jgi:hypothetical protein
MTRCQEYGNLLQDVRSMTTYDRRKEFVNYDI